VEWRDCDGVYLNEGAPDRSAKVHVEAKRIAQGKAK
jgi:hypothetical protein